MRAARRFAESVADNGLLAATARVHADLYGSLGATGRGHGTPKAIILGLEGARPDEIDPDTVDPRLAAVRQAERLQLLGRHAVAFREHDDIEFRGRERLPGHPNAMRMRAFDATEIELCSRTYFSVGGGFIVEEGEAQPERQQGADLPVRERRRTAGSLRGYRIHLSIHPVIDVLRDADGRLAGVFPPGAGMTGALPESLMQFEVDREPEPERLEALVGGIRRVVGDVRAAVEDWRLMRQRLREIVAGFESAAPPIDRSEVEEVNAFLEWVDGGNFIFLGYREYDLVGEAGEDSLRAVDGSGLGVLRDGSAIVSSSFARLPIEVRAMARSPQPLILTKANSRSTVHRPLYLISITSA